MEELTAYICDHICGKIAECETQEQADEMCSNCDVDERIMQALKFAYHRGAIDGLKKASEIAEKTILKPDIE